MVCALPALVCILGLLGRAASLRARKAEAQVLPRPEPEEASSDAADPVSGGEPRRYERVDSLFRGGDGLHHSYRIPSILGFGSGRLLAFAEGRTRCSGDYGDVNLVYRVSSDSGATWSELRYLAGVDGGSSDRDTWGNPTLLFERAWKGGPAEGRVHLFFNHNDRKFREGKSQHAGCPQVNDPWRPVQHGDRQTFYVFSDDGGESWSTRRNWTAELLPGSLKWDAAGPGIGLQKQFEPNRSMLVIPANSRNLISTDHGATWTSVMVTSNAGQYGMSEATVAECADGRLYRNDRPGPDAHRKQPRRWTVYLPKPDEPAAEASAPDMDLPDPRSQGSMLTYEPGLILFLNSDDERQRTRLRVHVSRDCGRTWPIKKYLYDELPREWPRSRGGYSSMTRTGDEVAVLTEGSFLDQSRPDFDKRLIDFLRFDLDWLCDGERYCRGASCAVQRVEQDRIYVEGSCAAAALGERGAEATVEVQLRRSGALRWQGPVPLARARGGAVEARCPAGQLCKVGDALLLPSA